MNNVIVPKLCRILDDTLLFVLLYIYSSMFLFSLLADVKEMEVPHLVNEKLRIRIGIHTGKKNTILYQCTIHSQ